MADQPHRDCPSGYTSRALSPMLCKVVIQVDDKAPCDAGLTLADVGNCQIHIRIRITNYKP